ncbi:unnamed protein product [Eruca vesicaria subsp. sativa]|uniref:NB-ARC domain-containing protein n=1 Tax=Eruca vesicaria subsp. sativa TaxID=29727 RepID=A0ABC8JSG1_ERUVS|nr:unnamed protein product [Eruca vesicaria subsp. sativa]
MDTIIGCLCSAVPSFQQIFSFLASHVHAEYIYKFDDNLDDLKTACEDLKAKITDLEGRVNAEEFKGQRRKDEVVRWLLKAKKAVEETSVLVATASPIGERLSTHGFCSTNPISAYSCGRMIPKKLAKVSELISEKICEELTRQSTLAKVVEQPTEQTVGLDTKLDSAWSLLMEEGTRMLGLYGMGGVGKTTLLTRINNKFVEVDKFDVVIWVTVSKDVDIEKIQDDIGKRLRLCDDKWCKKDQTEKRSVIFDVLTHKKPKYVLLLDGLWKEVSLTKIGIPLRQGGNYKIVFTTRSKSVSGRMNPNEQKEVECLGEKEALDLLMQNAGRRDGLSGGMLDLSKEIAKQCHGLPLALEVVGKCLSSRTTEADWGEVLCTLGSHPAVLEGMKKEMFGVLKVSYDYLERGEKDAQSCFKYCALFSLASNITQDELVEYWIGEGIIDVSQGRRRAERIGNEIINTLVGASLLLKDERKVHMHNMIREMALWIANEVTDGKRFHVQTDDARLTEMPYVPDCQTVSKMSLMNNEIKSITNSSSQFTNLVTLFLQNNKLADLVGGFFCLLSNLVVLDLSRNTGITELPDDISKLVSLRYLNLLGTRIKNLGGLKHLILLIHLNLESTSYVRSLRIISGLDKLQVLRFYGSAPLDRSLLESLETFQALELLTITVRDVDALESFLGSKKIRSCTQGLFLDRLQISGRSFAATFGELDSLSKLEMIECDIIETETTGINRYSPSTSASQITPSNTWFRNLSAVVLISCEHLKDVTWLIYAANLESLSIRVSHKMEELISEEKARDDVRVEPFKKLQVLDLDYLGELASIYWSPLSFPCLQKVHITNCPKLRKLPLDSTSVKKIDDLVIEMDDGWEDRIEWENGAKERFCRHTASDS